LFSFNTLLTHISKYFSLNIGDLVFTGTPPGVGEVVPGDVLEGVLEGESVLNLTVK